MSVSYLDTNAGSGSPTLKSTRTSALTNSIEWRSSPLNIIPKGTSGLTDLATSTATKSNRPRTSYHLQSPLFDIPRISPTFEIQLHQGQITNAKLDSSEAAPGQSGSTKELVVSSVPVTVSEPFESSDGSLLSATAQEDHALSSRSVEAQNDMIDQQLEMLGELFPVAMKKYSQTVDAKALNAAMSVIGNAPPVPQASSATGHAEQDDNSSDFHQSPPFRHRSRVSQLLSDWPDLADLDDSESESGSVAALAKLEQSTPGGHMSRSAGPPVMRSSSGEHSENSETSPASSLTARRSINPNLRVNTTNSQQYATKELQLIRKMKEEGRLKQEAKVWHQNMYIIQAPH